MSFTAPVSESHCSLLIGLYLPAIILVIAAYLNFFPLRFHETIWHSFACLSEPQLSRLICQMGILEWRLFEGVVSVCFSPDILIL